MATALWVIYDIISGVIGFWFLERRLTRNEKFVVALLVLAGIAVATYSGYSDLENSEQMTTLENKVTELSKGQAFNTGQLSAIGQIDAKTLAILANQTGTNPKAGPDAVANAASTKIDQLEREMAKIKERRHLTQAEKAAMRPVLEAHPGHFDISWARNSEAGAYAKEWIDFLTSAKWQLDYRSELPEQYDPGNEMRGIYLGVKDKNNAPPNAVVLDNALKTTKLEFGIADNSANSPNTPWLLIGDKP